MTTQTGPDETLPLMGPDGTDSDAPDGRSERRARNRRAVINAMVSLIDEGILDVRMEQAAARAGVSVRSVFRYFENADELRRETIDQHFALVDQRLNALPPTCDRHERIVHLVATRLDMFAAHAGPARIARQRAEFVPIVAAHLEHVRSRLTEHVRAQMAPELNALTAAQRDDVVSLLDVLVSLDTWEALHLVHGRDRAQAERMLADAVNRLLP